MSDDASETDGPRKMFEHAQEECPALFDGTLRWHEQRPKLHEWMGYAYRFVRAESEQRVRELERERDGLRAHLRLAKDAATIQARIVGELKAEKEAALSAYEHRGETIGAITRTLLGKTTGQILEADPVYLAEMRMGEKEAAEARAMTKESELERVRVQLAGCGVAALGGTKDPAPPGSYGWSASYGDVLALRLKFEAAEARMAAWRTVVMWATLAPDQTTPGERAYQISAAADAIPKELRPGEQEP